MHSTALIEYSRDSVVRRADVTGRPFGLRRGIYAEDFTDETLDHPLQHRARARRRAEHIAEAVCFLASDRASYITGKTLDADGEEKI